MRLRRAAITAACITGLAGALLSPGPAAADNPPPAAEVTTTYLNAPGLGRIKASPPDPEDLRPKPQPVQAEKPARQCGAADATGKKLCIEFGTPTAELDRRLSESDTDSRLAAGDDFVPWCADDPKLGNTITRYEACLKGWSPVTVDLTLRNATIATATFAMRQEIKLYPTDKHFNESITLVPVEIDPALVNVTLDWQVACGSPCESSLQSWDESLTWTPTDLHKARGQIGHWWGGASGNDEMMLGWTLIAHSPAAPKPAETSWSSLDLEIRCDDQVGGTTGCVFAQYTPTLAMDWRDYPAAAAYYYAMMLNLSGHPGSKDHGQPLHRLADRTQQQANRNIICDSTFTAYAQTPTPSCDEYPFAGTRESGAMLGVTSGQECWQAASYQDETGEWWVISDPGYPEPTPPISEVCGRATIPQRQNTDAGGDVGRFVQKVRLLDGEAWFLSVPGITEQ